MKEIYRRWSNEFFALFALAIMLSVLFLGQTVGMSDQSDFGRVMNASSLSHYVQDRAFVFIERYTIILEPNSLFDNAWRILFGDEGIENYPSIHLLFVRLSVVANLVINRITGAPLDIYRISILGAMTAVVYAALIYWLFRQIQLKNPMLDMLAKLVIIFIAVDIGYIAYFNSFFSESIQILAFMVLIVSGIRILKGRTSLLSFVWLVLAALLFGWSKFVNIPIAFVIIAAFAVILVFSADAGSRLRRAAPIFLIALVGLVPLILVFRAIPDWMEIDTNYNSVFFGIIKDVDDDTARRHLEALGLPPEMAQFASTNRYEGNVATAFRQMGFEEEFAQISKMNLLWFYMRHPALLWENVQMSVAHSGMIQPWYIANYGPEAQRLTLSERFSGWSWLRVRTAFDTLWGNAVLWLAFAAAFMAKSAAYLSHNGRRLAVIPLLAIAGSAAYSLVVQMIANGEADLAKHMFVYIQFADFAFVALLFGLFLFINERPKMIAELTKPSNLTRFAAPVVCIIILSVPLAASAVRSILPVSITPISEAVVGDTVSLGEFDGQELLWLVTDKTEEEMTLFALENIAETAFDSGNSSFWRDSDIRLWLNSYFLDTAFVDTDRIIDSRRDLILSIATQQLAIAGDRNFYAFHIPRYAFRGADRAFRMPMADMVRLPGAETMNQLLDMGQGHRIRGGFWLEIPRVLDGNMVRYVTYDGHVTMRDAMNIGGVRPVITIVR